MNTKVIHILRVNGNPKVGDFFVNNLLLRIPIATFIKKNPMKIHIIKDETFSNQTFKLIEDFLMPYFKKSLIKIKFHHIEYDDVESKDFDYEKVVEEDYKKYLIASNLVEIGDLNQLKSFKFHFDFCSNFRKKKKLSPDDLLIVLTEQRNEANWFGFIDTDLKNVFVCESNWTGYFKYNIQSYLPISHEILCWVVRSELFEDQKELIHNIHQQDKGCVMDLNRNKANISNKMKSMELCTDCEDFMNTNNAIIISNLSKILRDISYQLKNLNNKISNLTPSRITLRGTKKKIYLTDFQNVKINLEPIQTAVYVLFLRHEEGIQLSEVFTLSGNAKEKKPPLHPLHTELIEIYCQIKNEDPNDDRDNNVRTIRSRDVDEITRDISIIKNTFQSLLGDQLADHYIIEKNHESNRHFLKLDRGLLQ